MIVLIETLGIAIVDFILIGIVCILILDCIKLKNELKRTKKDIEEKLKELDFKNGLGVSKWMN